MKCLFIPSFPYEPVINQVIYIETRFHKTSNKVIYGLVKSLDYDRFGLVYLPEMEVDDLLDGEDYELVDVFSPNLDEIYDFLNNACVGEIPTERNGNVCCWNGLSDSECQDDDSIFVELTDEPIESFVDNGLLKYSGKRFCGEPVFFYYPLDDSCSKNFIISVSQSYQFFYKCQSILFYQHDRRYDTNKASSDFFRRVIVNSREQNDASPKRRQYATFINFEKASRQKRMKYLLFGGCTFKDNGEPIDYGNPMTLCLSDARGSITLCDTSDYIMFTAPEAALYWFFLNHTTLYSYDEIVKKANEIFLINQFICGNSNHRFELGKKDLSSYISKINAKITDYIIGRELRDRYLNLIKKTIETHVNFYKGKNCSVDIIIKSIIAELNSIKDQKIKSNNSVYVSELFKFVIRELTERKTWSSVFDADFIYNVGTSKLKENLVKRKIEFNTEAFKCHYYLITSEEIKGTYKYGIRLAYKSGYSKYFKIIKQRIKDILKEEQNRQKQT